MNQRFFKIRNPVVISYRFAGESERWALATFCEQASNVEGSANMSKIATLKRFERSVHSEVIIFPAPNRDRMRRAILWQRADR